MGYPIHFLQYDEEQVNNRWKNILETKNIGRVYDNPNLIDEVMRGEHKDNYFDLVYEIYISLVMEASRFEFMIWNGAAGYTVIDFLISIKLGKKLKDFGDIADVDFESWGQIFTDQPSLHDIESHSKQYDFEGSKVSNEMLLECYIKGNGVYQFAKATNTVFTVLVNGDSWDDYWFKRYGGDQKEVENTLKAIAETGKKKLETAPKFAEIKLSTKEFFIPIIQVEREESLFTIGYRAGNGEKISYDHWASRVLPGDTYKNTIKRELNSVLGYSGRFKISSRKHRTDELPDRNGDLIQRFFVWVTLLDKVELSDEVLGHKVELVETINLYHGI